MKKTLSGFSKQLLCLLALFMLSTSFTLAQSRFVQVPARIDGTSTLNRAPNGSVDFQRTSILYLGSEMPTIPANTNLTSIGFSLETPAATNAVGTIKVYMVNTTDVTNTRGATWASIISTPTAMQLVYDGPLTIPNTAGFYNITFQTPFMFTGSNFYLAYEWHATTKSAAAPSYNASTALPGTPLVTAAGTSLPATLTNGSAFRPILRVGYLPPADDLSVAAIYALGKLPTLGVTNPHITRAAVINTGQNTKTNITVTLAVTGANTFNTTATIPSLPGGDTIVVSFPSYSVTTTGTNTLTVSVPADDNATNNSATYTQIVTTGEISHATGNPPVHTTALRPLAPNGTLLAKFNVSGPIIVPSVNMMVSFNTDNVGQTIYAVLFDATGSLIGRSPNYVIQASDLSTMKNFPITTPPTLTSGDFYAGIAALPSATVTYFPLGVQDESPMRPNTFFTSQLTGGTLTPLSSNYRLIIEPVLSTCTPPAMPTIAPASPIGLCSGGTVTLTATSATPGVTYEWYRNGTPVTGASTATLAVTTTGNYTVAAISGTCSSAVSAITNVVNGTPVTPTITASGPTTFCDGETLTLTAATTTTGVTYQWSKDGTAISGATTATYAATTAGNYTVTATSGTCDATSTATTLTVTPAPATPTITQNGHTLTSSATTGNQWLLNGSPILGATNQTYLSTANGTYTVTVTDNGCTSVASAAVTITNTGISDDLAGMSVQIFPNPASASFHIKLHGYTQDATLALYNLTGQLLQTDNLKAGQSGKQIKVKGLAAGTYLLKVTSLNGTQIKRLVIE